MRHIWMTHFDDFFELTHFDATHFDETHIEATHFDGV